MKWVSTTFREFVTAMHAHNINSLKYVEDNPTSYRKVDKIFRRVQIGLFVVHSHYRYVCNDSNHHHDSLMDR